MRPTRQPSLNFSAFSQDNPSSIMAVHRQGARGMRAPFAIAFPGKCGEDLNGPVFHGETALIPAEEMKQVRTAFCDAIRFGSHRFHGVTDATLPHDEGWEFLRVGWFIERAGNDGFAWWTCSIMPCMTRRRKIGGSDNHQWMAVLKSVGAYEAYHKKYHSSIDPEKVAEMLIMHPLHPRSIRFSMTEVQSGCAPSAATGSGSYANEAERLTGKVLERLRYDRIHEIFNLGLHSYLNDMLRMCGFDWRRHCAKLLLLCGGGMNRYHLLQRDGISLRRPGSESL